MTAEHNPRVAAAKRAFIIEYGFPMGHLTLAEMGFTSPSDDVLTAELSQASERLNAVAGSVVGQAIRQLAHWAAESVSRTDPQQVLPEDLQQWEYDRFSEHFVRFGQALITTALNEGIITVNDMTVIEE